MVGKTIAHYEITEKLGEGGMGVVYKARDTHLDRFVAIKVLPPERVADPERKRRFVQEAKAASALNHPNIITIHDIAQAQGIDFIVMEYVAGKTLDRLTPRKGTRVNDALKYALQIAEALSKAHSAGIVHRDLKPGNVMVTGDGLVKVLDFGLAKLTETIPPGEDEPTRTLRPQTEEGTIVGTVAYMSPEQAQGKHIDARSDIFSFGALLYEMITGGRAFHGDTKLSTLAAIINQEPAPLTADIPRDLERLITRCLRKQPERRFQHMDDVKVALEELKEESDSGRLAAALVAERKPRRKLVWSAAVLAMAVGAVLGVWLLGPSRETPVAQLRAVPLTSYPGSEEYPSLSPDGNQVAFSWDGEKRDNTDLYVQPVGPGTPLRLTTHPAPDVSPAWSPDGRWIAFVRLPPGKLQIILIPPLGGPERVLVDIDSHPARRPFLAWMPDGKWLAGPCKEAAEELCGMCLFSIESGEKRRLTSPPANTLGDTAPAISPDGRSLVFCRYRSAGSDDLYVLHLTSGLTAEGEPRKLTPESGFINGATWTPDGREIIYSMRDVLWRIAAAGSAKPEQLVFAGGDVTHPVISGARRRLVYSWGYSDSNIWRLELASPTKAASRSALISSSRVEGMPEYSPDGKKVLFQSNRSGSVEIWTCHSDGSNWVQVTSQEEPNRFDPRWSQDGKYIVFTSASAGQSHLYVVGAEGGKAQRLSTGASSDSRGSWSRDGRWIYFTSLRTGRFQVWKMPWTPGVGRESEAVQVTHNGGLFPLESLDGKYVYYANSRTNAGLWRVPAQGGGEVQVLPALDDPAAFAVAERGIYFIPPRKAEGTRSIHFLELATGKTYQVATFDKPMGPRLAVSPDGRSLLYHQVDQESQDLMLVENFR